MILILFILFLVILFFLLRIKKLKLDAVTMVNGGVKCGKTTLTVALAIKKYKNNHFKWAFFKKFAKIFHLKFNKEEPLLYSNIPLKCDYVPLTTELIAREKRMNYKSVAILSESSLVIDSMSYEDPVINERVSLFIKLYGHSTRGGSLFIETQAMADNHYAVKRSLARYIWIHSLIKWIPFVLVFRAREMAFSDNQGVTNAFNEDIEESTKLVIISKSVWKKFDTYCYSSFTDDLPKVNNVIKKKNVNDLKVHKIVSFKEYYTLPNDKILIPINKKKGAKKNETKQ